MEFLTTDVPSLVVTSENVLRKIIIQVLQDVQYGPTAQRKLLKETEAAHELGVKPQTMAVWRTKGTGPGYVKCGSSVRYPRDSINDYIQKNSVSL